jgi:hypothetical protein
MNLMLKPKHTSIHNQKKKNTRLTKKLNWLIESRFHLNYYTNFIIIPFNWKALLMQTGGSTYLYMYSRQYFTHTKLPSITNNYFFDANTNILSFTNIAENNFTKLYINELQHLLNLCNQPHFLKLKFKGKGYYIYKNKRSTITPQFGFAHRHYIYAFYISVKFRTKTSIMLYGASRSDLFTVGALIKAMRPINIFTGRGVRFNKQHVYKKTGKVSSYR